MKVNLIYNGDSTMSTKEVDLLQIPRIGDGLCVLETPSEEFAFCVVESIDWWIENGKLRNVDLFLKDGEE